MTAENGSRRSPFWRQKSHAQLALTYELKVCILTILITWLLFKNNLLSFIFLYKKLTRNTNRFNILYLTTNSHSYIHSRARDWLISYPRNKVLLRLTSHCECQVLTQSVAVGIMLPC